MAKMKYWNGTSWIILDAADADTVDGAHAGTGANNVLKLDSSGKVPIGNLPSADATNQGAVVLSTSISDTSTTKAATPSAVKTAYDLANGKYSKPAAGIPKTDLDSGVQNSLIPANGTTNNGKFLQAGATAGTYTWADVSVTGTSVNITDSGNYYTGTEVESALQEIGQTLNNMRGNLITSANNILGS